MTRRGKPVLRLWLLAAALVVACGDSGNQNTPTAPSPAVRPTVVLTVPSAPLTAMAPPTAGARPTYALVADVSLREMSGAAARVVLLALSLLDDAGPLAPTLQQAASVEVPALGTVSHELRVAFELERAVEQGRARVGGRGQDAQGVAFDLTPVEVPIRFAAAGPPPVPSVTFVGAGDIGQCGSEGPGLTAQLLDGIPGVVFTLGDNAYPDASPANFQNCYHPSWGRHRDRTRPIPGNHDWYNNTWFGYFDYFGPVAGPPGLGYYSFDLGAWHVLALNSNLHGNVGSAQYEFARADLASTRASCVLAYWHHPRYSSGPSGGDRTMRDIWRLLQEHGAEFVMSGHDHIYERFAPQDSDGRLDLVRGLRSFVVGTGGYALYALGPRPANSEVRDNQTWGVLRLTLHPTGYDWEFVPVAGGAFRDSGTATCSP